MVRTFRSSGRNQRVFGIGIDQKLKLHSFVFRHKTTWQVMFTACVGVWVPHPDTYHFFKMFLSSDFLTKVMTERLGACRLQCLRSGLGGKDEAGYVNCIVSNIGGISYADVRIQSTKKRPNMWKNMSQDMPMCLIFEALGGLKLQRSWICFSQNEGWVSRKCGWGNRSPWLIGWETGVGNNPNVWCPMPAVVHLSTECSEATRWWTSTCHLLHSFFSDYQHLPKNSKSK